MTVTALVEGLALHLSALDLGAYRRGEPYRDGETAIVLRDVIPDPDRLIVIRPYDSGGEGDALRRWSEPRIQFRTRGDRDGDSTRSADLADSLHAALHGAGPLRLPNGVLVMSIIALQDEAVPIGRDPVGRYEHTLNTRIDYLRTA